MNSQLFLVPILNIHKTIATQENKIEYLEKLNNLLLAKLNWPSNSIFIDKEDFLRQQFLNGFIDYQELDEISKDMIANNKMTAPFKNKIIYLLKISFLLLN